MNICIAQTRAVKGDIQGNLDNHKKFINLAVAHRAKMIIFPELSLTSYEPELAKELAININDTRLDCLQMISDNQYITIGVGVPVIIEHKICIGMIIFQPKKPRQVYLKKYLHPDEEEFFVSGNNAIDLFGEQKNISLAICYELSVPDHAENAYQCGAKIYLASVAKTVSGVEKAIPRLSDIANKYAMVTAMSNCVGEFNRCVSGGKSSVWNKNGVLMGELDDSNEGILIFDEKEVVSEILVL